MKPIKNEVEQSCSDGGINLIRVESKPRSGDPAALFKQFNEIQTERGRSQQFMLSMSVSQSTLNDFKYLIFTSCVRDNLARSFVISS